MFANILKLAAAAMIKKWLAPSSAYATTAPTPSPIQLNTPQIKLLAVKIVSLVILAFLNFLLFVGGVIVTAVAAAHSIDVFGGFQATSVFWAGVIMAGTALTLGALSGRALLSTEITTDDFIINRMEPELEPLSVTDRLVRPFFEGVIAGLRSPRYSRFENDDNGRGYPAA